MNKQKYKLVEKSLPCDCPDCEYFRKISFYVVEDDTKPSKYRLFDPVNDHTSNYKYNTSDIEKCGSLYDFGIDDGLFEM